MKNKPQRHKEDNVFRFKSFSDRIRDIKIKSKTIHHIGHKNEELQIDGVETEFHSTYRKWIDLNKTNEYKEFQKEIRGIVTLEQLVNKKEHVLEILLTSLRKATTASLEPLLKFVVVLAKELRQEFYIHFQSFLTTLIGLLNTKDADQLEWTLICLAELFSELKYILIKDLTVVFNLVLPLLDERNPEHITNFAAECFSFVVRDIKDKEKLLRLIMNGLKAHNNSITGCGRLLTDIIRGIAGQFHSCAADHLQVWFSSLAKTDIFDQETLYGVLSVLVDDIVKITHPSKMEPFWNVCFAVLKKFIETANVNDQAIQYLLEFIGRVIEYCSGKYVSNSSDLVAAVVTALNADKISEKCLAISTQIVAALLLSNNVVLTQVDASIVTRKVLSLPYPKVFESFVWNVVELPQFHVQILPEFLRYIESKYYNATSLELLAKIVMKKSPLCRDGLNFAEKKFYSLSFKTDKATKKIEKTILDGAFDGINIPKELLLAAIIYPHIDHRSNSDRVLTKINELIACTLDHLSSDHDSIESIKLNRRVIFVLSILIETQIHLANRNRDEPKRLEFPPIIDRLIPFCQQDDFKYAHALRVLDLIVTSEITQAKSQYFDLAFFTLIHSKLSDNLWSRFREFRLLTAHLFQQLSHKLGVGRTHHGISIYNIFYDVDSIIPTTETERKQTLHLQKLEASPKLFEAITKESEICKFDPLKYLLGGLYVNFSSLWNPLTKLIQTHASELDLNEFWPIIETKLKETTRLVRRNGHPLIEDDLDELFGPDSALHDDFSQAWENTERSADLINYRILLWKLIPNLGMAREIKNREIVTAFLDFINEEYRKSHDNDTFTWNILKDRDQNETMDIDEVDLDEQPEQAEQTEQAEQAEQDKDDRNEEHELPKATQRTLTIMLQVFVNQSNPKQLHREPELRALYTQLLSHRNSAVQKLALDCLIAYKHKYLQPYKEHIYNLIDDNKFKVTLTKFEIGKESNVLQEEHRQDLMPIIMRILFSKMHGRVGGQKHTNQLRKSLIMRFLGGCNENEVFIMLSMSNWMFEERFTDNLMDICKTVTDSTDLACVLSPRKLQSSIDLINVIQVEFSGSMSSAFHRYLLKILVVIGSIIHGVLNDGANQSRISRKVYTLFKNLRNACIDSLQIFCNHINGYPWINDEIDTIFTLFVNPLVQKLPQDSLNGATSLVKLLSIFGKTPRLFVLLTKHTAVSTSDEDSTPLRYLMDLLVEPKVHRFVAVTIMELIQNLLTLADDADSEPLILTHCRPIETARLEVVSDADSLNYGSKIVLPYLSNILQKLRNNLKHRRGLTKREVLILSKITELITDTKTCSALLTLLLPIFVRKSHSCMDEEALLQIVNTIINLFNKIDNPEKHIRNIAPLFEQITAVGPRKRLCELLRVINERSENDLSAMVEVIRNLNALDRRWVEQPDYEKRILAYTEINELLSKNQIDINFGLLIIYHSFHFIRHDDKSFALRDNASLNLKTLVPALIKRYQTENSHEVNYLIGTVILNMVRRTLRDKNDRVRYEGIGLIGEMARECPDAHPVLADLHRLTSKEDPEIDFFENISHLQTLRHGRALIRFSKLAKELEQPPNPRTLTQFILPLASFYIANEKYAANHNIINSAIETIGSICKLLPWFQYEAVLKEYLNSMRSNVKYQKQMIRIVIEILDAFHFDLSNAKISPDELESVLKKANKVQIEDIESDNIKSKSKVKDEKEEGEEEVVIRDDDNLETEFDKEIDNINQASDNQNEDDEIPIKKAKIFCFDQAMILPQSVAKKLVFTIATGLIPKLNNSITAFSTFENIHKSNAKKHRSEREEEELLRVPIVLPVVKLLQKLPAGILEHKLPGLLTKVCYFLRSRSKEVRYTAGNTLKQVMLTVGSSYLEIMLNQICTVLTRGFQLHVLAFVVHFILDALKDTFEKGTIDKSLQSILEITLRDIFGQTAEEKEITKIGRTTPEAKQHKKMFLTLNIISTNISESCLLDLLTPFKDTLKKCPTKKTVEKVQECLVKIVSGLNVNKHISNESKLIFIYGVISESIPNLVQNKPKPELTEKQQEKIRRETPDCFLIPADPAAGGRNSALKKSVVISDRATSHVFIEFGIDLLLATLARDKLWKAYYQPYIDQFVPILLDSLTSQHIRVTTLSLRCLRTMCSKKLELTKLNEFIPRIVENIFIILHRYAAINTDMSSENFKLVQSSFKTLVAILGSTTVKYELTEEQLKSVFLYIEQYLAVNNSTKQTISFSLLKVLIGRRLKAEELNTLIMSVCQLAIQSDSEEERAESKGIIVNYLMDYPLKKQKVQAFIDFFLSNLEYEVESGRKSAINVLHSIVKRFPEEILNRQGKFDLLFTKFGWRLVNDESPQCKEQIAECIQTLLSRITLKARNSLFAIVQKYLQNQTEPLLCEMGALLCTQFVNSQKAEFDGRIKTILPVLVDALTLTSPGLSKAPGQFVRITRPEEVDDEDDALLDEEEINRRREVKLRASDNRIMQLLFTIIEIFKKYPDSSSFDSNTMDTLAYESQKLLAHDHLWVRLNALEILEFILQRIDVDEFHRALVKGETTDEEPSYLFNDPGQEIYSLTLDLCAQFSPGKTDNEMAKLVTKNLLLIANLLKDVPYGTDASNGVDNDEGHIEKQKKVNLPWLMRRIRYIIHGEVAKAPHIIIFRSCAFDWIEGIVHLLPTESVQKLAYTLLQPLVREMSEEDININSRLRKIAIRVGESIRDKIGNDQYNILRSQIQKKLMIRRAERRKVIAMEKISDPVRAAQRTKGIRDRKVAAKRRLRDDVKNGVVAKRKRVNHHEDEF